MTLPRFETITLTAIAAITLPALGETLPAPHISSPMTIHAERAPADVAEFATRVSVDKSVLDGIEPGDHLFLDGVPLDKHRTVTLQLEAFSALAPDAVVVEVVQDERGNIYETERTWPAIHLFRGSVVGEPGSKVFLAVGNHLTNGWISTSGTRFVIATHAGKDLTLIHDESNVPEGFYTGAPYVCDVTSSSRSRKPRGDYGEPRGIEGESCAAVRVAYDSDYEFGQMEAFGSEGTAAAEYVQTLVGDVSKEYEGPIGVKLIGAYLRIWAVDADPWDEGSLGAQLGQFGAFWYTNMGDIDRNLAHLFCGRNLGGGMAAIGAVCSDLIGYGVSTGLNGTYPMPLEDGQDGNWDPIVYAHETGHNFNMIHTHEFESRGEDNSDECGNGDCGDAGGATIMSYCHTCDGGIANINMEFDQLNIDWATEFLDSLSCDLMTPQTPPSVTNDRASCEKTGSVDVYVLANDFANDCSTLDIERFDVTSMRGGLVVDASDWDDNEPPLWHNALNYSAPGTITGMDSFSYTAIDANGQEATAEVFITIPKPPVVDGGGDDDFNVDDVVHILRVWGSRSADWDGNGVVNGDDIIAVIDGRRRK